MGFRPGRRVGRHQGAEASDDACCDRCRRPEGRSRDAILSSTSRSPKERHECARVARRWAHAVSVADADPTPRGAIEAAGLTVPARAGLLDVDVTDDPLPVFAQADGVLDFTAPAATIAFAALAAQARIVHVIGTTGLQEARLHQARGGRAPCAHRAVRQHVARREPARRPRAQGSGDARRRFRHRDPRDAPPHEGGCALRHGAAARRGGGGRPRDLAEGPLRAQPRRPYRRAQSAAISALRPFAAARWSASTR